MLHIPPAQPGHEAAASCSTWQHSRTARTRPSRTIHLEQAHVLKNRAVISRTKACAAPLLVRPLNLLHGFGPQKTLKIRCAIVGKKSQISHLSLESVRQRLLTAGLCFSPPDSGPSLGVSCQRPHWSCSSLPCTRTPRLLIIYFADNFKKISRLARLFSFCRNSAVHLPNLRWHVHKHRGEKNTETGKRWVRSHWQPQEWRRLQRKYHTSMLLKRSPPFLLDKDSLLSKSLSLCFSDPAI